MTSLVKNSGVIKLFLDERAVREFIFKLRMSDLSAEKKLRPISDISEFSGRVIDILIQE
ncbi:hypothetical protein HYY70_06260 [Candidatus Woesearchaeota archaeon]|nr:hypothetical protein [Candidatus Woesearchaeota archaeon]